MVIQICVGSSCHLRGSAGLVELFQKAVADRGLQNEITLAGNFCAGKCNKEGVTVIIDDNVYTGVTPDNFSSFFKENVLTKVH